jgi:hypothetical protein
MDRQRRIFQRFTGKLPGSLYLCLGRNGSRLGRPIRCHVADLSRKGAGIFASQIISDSHHLFFAALESDKHILHLDIECTGSQGETEIITLPVRPIWFDRVLLLEEQQPFVLGVEFYEKLSRDLFQRLHDLCRH